MSPEKPPGSIEAVSSSDGPRVPTNTENDLADPGDEHFDIAHAITEVSLSDSAASDPVEQNKAAELYSIVPSSQLQHDKQGDIAALPDDLQMHRRNESLPPQKYDLGEEHARGISKPRSLQTTIEETDISSYHHDISLTSSSYSVSPEPSRPQLLDRADLNFVDIALADSGTLDPHHPLSASLRSAEQIRTDSFSSQAPPKSPACEVELSHAHLTRSESHQSNASDSLRVDDSDSSRYEHWDAPARRGSDSRSVSAGSVLGDRKPVEGRYRGRVSRSSSRAASPGLEPGSSSRRASVSREGSQSPSVEESFTSAPPQAADFLRPALRPAPILVAADEDGNISIASDVPISPHTTSAPVDSVTSQDLLSGSIDRDAISKTSVANGDTSSKSPKEEHDKPAGDEAVAHAETASAKGPGLSDKADQIGKSSANAPEMMESRTRMTNLPAKSKAEEIRHRGDFEKMMMFAKEQEKKRQEEESERRRRKQDEQRQALGQWEKDILPSWTRARKDEALTELWWKGAPPSIRGRVWALAIGNPLMLPRNLLDQTIKWACTNDGTLETVIPPNALDAIDEDVQDTLPTLKLFQESGPLHADLLLICKAFVLVRMQQVRDLDSAGDADKAASELQSTSPRPRTAPLPATDNASESDATTEDIYAQRGIEIYQRGLAVLAATLLINLPASTAFICLLNLIHSKAWLKALYSLLPTRLPDSQSLDPSDKSTHRGSAYNLSPKEKSIRGFERVLETLLADKMPKVYANLLARNVKLYRVVLRDWVGQLFGKHLDIDTVMRLWDVILLDETDSLIYRTCLALVQTLESRLYVPDQEELESVLQGTNKAALHIWRREKEPTGELMLHVPASPRRPSRASFSSHGLRSPTTASISAGLDIHPSAALPHSPSDPHFNHFGMSEAEVLPKDYIYEQYGIKEDNIFETLQEQKGSWKQSTLQRLLERELGD